MIWKIKVFYSTPCCGIDFQIIPKLLDHFKIIGVNNNFIFIDANNDRISFFSPIEFIGNKLGLQNIKIIEKHTFEFDSEFCFEIVEILNGYDPVERGLINEYIKGNPNPKVTRFALKHEDVEFILYYFYFEAVTIIKYINSLNLQTTNKGLILCVPHGGWTDLDTIVSKIISALTKVSEGAKNKKNRQFYWRVLFSSLTSRNLQQSVG